MTVMSMAAALIANADPGTRLTFAYVATRATPTDSSCRPSWQITRDGEDGWYRLEARPESQEFLIWFGNRQVGAALVHWIMRPAVHLALSHVGPEAGLLRPAHLGDVLDWMLRVHEFERQKGIFTETYPMNDFPLT